MLWLRPKLATSVTNPSSTTVCYRRKNLQTHKTWHGDKQPHSKTMYSHIGLLTPTVYHAQSGMLCGLYTQIRWYFGPQLSTGTVTVISIAPGALLICDTNPCIFYSVHKSSMSTMCSVLIVSYTILASHGLTPFDVYMTIHDFCGAFLSILPRPVLVRHNLF